MKRHKSRLKKLRHALGLSRADLSGRIMIHQCVYGHMERGTQSPLKRTGEWRKDALRIALYYENFGLSLEDIFPEHASVILGDPERVDLAHQLSTYTHRRLTEGPDKALERKELRRRTVKALSALSNREAEVLVLRFGLSSSVGRKTLEEIGKTFNVTRERIRQIEAKALRRLRHPRLAILLRDFVEAT